jgi:hypothetical protein
MITGSDRRISQTQPEPTMAVSGASWQYLMSELPLPLYLEGDVHFSMRHRQFFLLAQWPPLVDSSNLLPVGGLGLYGKFVTLSFKAWQ